MQVNVVSEKNICFSDTAVFNEQIFQAHDIFCEKVVALPLPRMD